MNFFNPERRDGIEAYQNGETPDDNPYEDDEKEHYHWLAGFFSACRDDDSDDDSD